MSNESGVNPTGIRVIVRVPNIEEKTGGGIIITKMTQEAEERANMTGMVVAIAEDAKKCQEMRGISVGDTIFFARYAGSNAEWHVKGVGYKVMNATDIIGRMEGEMDTAFRAAKSSIEAFGMGDNQPAAA